MCARFNQSVHIFNYIFAYTYVVKKLSCVYTIGWVSFNCVIILVVNFYFN